MSGLQKVLKRILPTHNPYPSYWHEMADFGRIAFLLLSIAMFICGFLVPLSSHAYLLLTAQLIIVYSTLYKSFAKKLRIALVVVGSMAVLIGFGFRMKEVVVESNPISTVPSARFFPGLNSLLKEEDGVYLGLRLLSLIGGVTSTEYAGLQQVLEREYSVLRVAYGDFPTPLIATFFGAQSSSAFDLISFPATQTLPKDSKEKTAVIFLHGVGGNWTLPCWIIAQSVSDLGFYTFCPSTGPLGTWGSQSGSGIFEALLSQLKRGGFSNVYLAGISAGAVGATALARQYQNSLAGLILISGLGPGITNLQIQTLLITGKEDERFTPQIVRWVFRHEKGSKTLLEHHWLEGDHLAIVKKKETIQMLIRSWLASKSIIEKRTDFSSVKDEKFV